MADTYRIVRYYRGGTRNRRVLHTGVSLEEAQRHCNDPKTSSTTNRRSLAGRALPGMPGTRAIREQWFDGYERE